MNATTYATCPVCRATNNRACAKVWFNLRVGRVTVSLYAGRRVNHAGRRANA